MLHLKDLVNMNGHKIVKCDKCLPNHKYMSVFNYSEKYGGTIDSFKYYNDYVIDITDKAEIIKRIKADINKYKKAIIKEVKASGISENLGQKYVRKLRDEYYCSYDTEAITEIMNCITAFDEWCMNFDLSQVN